MEEKAITNRLEINVKNLKTIKESLVKQVYLSHTNKAYIMMNAHRVGLLSDDEYLIQLDIPLFNTVTSYSPGTIIQNKESFSVSIPILFFSTLIIIFIIYSIYIIQMQKKIHSCHLSEDINSSILNKNE